MASWGTPFTRRSISNFGFLSTGETEFRSSFLELIEPGSVVVPLTFLSSVPTAVSWKWVKRYQRVAAAVIANCTQVSPLAQVEGLRFFRTVFDVRFEKLPCRCNSPAQECVRWLHSISSARIEILDLVLGTIFPNTRHLDHVSNCYDRALSWALWSHHWVLLHLDLPRKGWKCEEDGLSSFLVLFSSCNESVLKDGVNDEGTNSVEHKLFLSVRN